MSFVDLGHPGLNFVAEDPHDVLVHVVVFSRDIVFDVSPASYWWQFSLIHPDNSHAVYGQAQTLPASMFVPGRVHRVQQVFRLKQAADFYTPDFNSSPRVSVTVVDAGREIATYIRRAAEGGHDLTDDELLEPYR